MTKRDNGPVNSCGTAALGCDRHVAFFTLGMMYSENGLSDFTYPVVEVKRRHKQQSSVSL